MDVFTAMGVRANFARICVQVDLDRPLPPYIWMGKWKNMVQYEGFTSICFECGRVGH